MLYNGVFGCHGNTCYVIFIGAILYMLYSIGPINVCVPILRSIGTKLTKLENMQISRFIWVIWRHVTQKRYLMRHGDSTLLIGILTGNILKPTRILYDFRFKSYGSNGGFRVFGDLDLDLWPMFHFFVTRIAHGVLEYPCEVSLESVQYEWVICCG